jgi:O-succinylhomoserine sulfhydrylase
MEGAMAQSDAKKKLPRTKLPANAHIETLAVREGMPATAWGENSEALFLTSSFTHPNAATAAARFANEEEAFVYSRFTNPTVMMFERRLAALEGTEAAIATASGMSAILLMVMGLLKAGDHVICSRSVFGATIVLLEREFGKFGVETTFVSQTDINEWRAAIKPNTKLLFAETPSNPLTEVCDISALAEIAHANGALLAVDNCFCTPALQRPVKLGADLIIHSGTKYLDGQGRVLAGAICGSDQLINGTFMPVMRGAGMSLSAFNAWVVLKGLETLAIRMAAQSANAIKLAQWLEQQPAIDKVYYPGLPSHPQHALAMKQQSGCGGAVVSFTVKPMAEAGGQGANASADVPARLRQAAFHVIDHTQLCSITANLGDTKTLITHPGSTSHGRLQEAQRLAAGITQGMVRISVGLEHIDDLTADLARGLDSLKV